MVGNDLTVARETVARQLPTLDSIARNSREWAGGTVQRNGVALTIARISIEAGVFQIETDGGMTIRLDTRRCDPPTRYGKSRGLFIHASGGAVYIEKPGGSTAGGALYGWHEDETWEARR